MGGLDVRRKHFPLDVLDPGSGTVGRGRVTPADRESFRRRLAGFDGEAVDLVVAGCTGWRFIVQECQVVGEAGSALGGVRRRRQPSRPLPASVTGIRTGLTPGTGGRPVAGHACGHQELSLGRGRRPARAFQRQGARRFQSVDSPGFDLGRNQGRRRHRGRTLITAAESVVHKTRLSGIPGLVVRAASCMLCR